MKEILQAPHSKLELLIGIAVQIMAAFDSDYYYSARAAVIASVFMSLIATAIWYLSTVTAGYSNSA